MRIISGKYKAKQIAYNSKAVRPTTHKVRGAFFSIIADQIENAKFLDLFCGSASMSIEALSRGAAEAVGIDLNLRLAYKNKNDMDLDSLSLYKNDAMRAIKIFGKKQEQFDVIFIDPPYAYKPKNDLLSIIYDFDILKSPGILCLETGDQDKIVQEIGDLKLEKTYKYGQTRLHVFYS